MLLKKKSKFRFNPETLSYEKVHTSVRQWIIKAFTHVSFSAMLGIVLMFIYLEFFPSPMERTLKEENRELKLHYNLLNGKLNQISKVVEDLQYRDDNIYRMIFESEPVSSSVRKAGFGGVNRYEDLEHKPNMEIVLETSKRIDILTKQLYIQSKSFDEIIDLAKGKDQMLRSIPAIMPLAEQSNTHFVSGFGYRIHPIYKTKKMHTGADWSSPQGTKIFATGDGVIAVAEFNRGYGKHVVISHGFSYHTLYGHMSVIKVKVGQKIKRGDIIGLVGSTGTSTGPHLHYEVIKSSKAVDPINYYLNDLTPEEYADMIEISAKPNQSFD